MTVVVDASAVLSALFPDEAESRHPDVFSLLNAGGVLVPAIWPTEIANGLFKAVHRRRTNWDAARGALTSLAAVQVEIVGFDFAEIEKSVLPLARRHSLTAYDTLYLHLAKSRNASLLSNDVALRQAAQNEGVELR